MDPIASLINTVFDKIQPAQKGAEKGNTLNQNLFNFIRYANCWEDPEILLAAMQINPDSRCLSIASGGDNALALLTANPAYVLAIDLNPAQIACTEIKIAAFKELEHHETLQFLGFKDPLFDRLDTFNIIKKNLSKTSLEFWENNPDTICKGIIHSGKFEKYFQLFHSIALPLVHNKTTIKELLEKKPRQERIDFYNQKWNTPRWQLLFQIFFSRLFMGQFGRDPQFFKFVEGTVANRILQRTQYAFTELPTDSNPYLNYIMTGKFKALPYYIRPENYDIIKSNLHKLHLYTGTLENALENNQTKYDAFNLSDIFEYLDESTFKQLGEILCSHAKTSATLVYWNMLVDRRLSELMPEKINYIKVLSEELLKKDRAFFYKNVIVEEVK
jgi:S-adenosylmethionine-diacylglycerol 3-amino-3-carboxypropyl transferase